MGICRSLYYSFNFVNMRFLVKLYFSLLNSTRRFTFMESLLLSHMFPCMNKFLFTEDNFLPRLIKQESNSSPHCTSRVFMP